MVPPKNPNKHLLSDDETYVDWIVEHIFKTQDVINILNLSMLEKVLIKPLLQAEKVLLKMYEIKLLSAKK